MSNQYQRWEYEPVPTRKKPRFPWDAIILALSVLFAMYRAWNEDWGKMAFSLIAAVFLAFMMKRRES